MNTIDSRLETDDDSVQQAPETAALPDAPPQEPQEQPEPQEQQTAEASALPLPAPAMESPEAPAEQPEQPVPSGQEEPEASPPLGQSISPEKTDFESKKKEYWKKVLTGNPATLPSFIRKKAGVDEWDAPEEQKEYHLLAAVNKSWAADHLPRTREQISSSWPSQRAEMARKLRVRNNEHEVFLALSQDEADAPRKEAAAQIFNRCYLAGLDGEQNADVSAWTSGLSDEDSANAGHLAAAAYEQGKQSRLQMVDLAERIARGLDAFAAVEEEAVSAPRVVSAVPDLYRAIDELADLDEAQQNTALYLAAGMARKEAKDAPGLLARGMQAMRRGAAQLGMGALQAFSHAGIATLNRLGEQIGDDDLEQTAQNWDKRMRVLERLRRLSQDELRPLVLPQEEHKAASYLITAAEAAPSALLSCCGGAGFSALTLGAVGDAVAEARARAPMASQELQLYAGLLAGAIQAGIYMNLNRVGGRLLEQSISRIGRAGGQGLAGYTLAGLNVMGGTTVEAAKLLIAGKLAHAADLGAQELAARLSKTASNIDWHEFGDNLTDVEANMHEAAALLPFLLLGSGRLALQHFRQPRAILGEGKLLSDWGIPEPQQEAILSQRDIALKSQLLQQAITQSDMWSGMNFVPVACRALKLLHSDSFQEFRNASRVHDFLKLPPPAQEAKPANAEEAPASPTAASEHTKLAEAMTLWNEWWGKSRFQENPATYPDQIMYSDLRATPTERHTENYLSTLRLQYSPLPRRVLQLGIYAPQAAQERDVILRDRISDLHALSYQFLMNIYSIDVLARDKASAKALKSRAEYSRQCLLGSVARTVLSTVRGENANDALANLEKYVTDFYKRRKYKSVQPGWLENTPHSMLRHMSDLAESHPSPRWDESPEMLESFRLVSGLKAGVDSLISLLPLTTDFQTALTRGLSPTQAYESILSRELSLPEKMLHRGAARAQKDIKNVTPMRKYSRENAKRFAMYSQLTGATLERIVGDDQMVYSRVRRPNGVYTHWHTHDRYAMNDLAGNADLFFLPFGHENNVLNVYGQDKSEINLMKMQNAESNEFSVYDQLCSQARRDMGQLWLQQATCLQPGLQMEQMRRFFRFSANSDGLRPIIVRREGKSAHRYAVDSLSDVTPLSMAQSRFSVYWHRMVDSGRVSFADMGDYLVAAGEMTNDEVKSALSAASISNEAEDEPTAQNARNTQAPVKAEQARCSLVEKMADYTALRFLAMLPELPVPDSVKEWVGMAAFCPPVSEEPVQRQIEMKQDRSGLISWANRLVADKLKNLAPKIDAMRRQAANPSGSLMDELIQRAIAPDDIQRSEQGWCFHKCGQSVLHNASMTHWDMLRSPRKVWEMMSDNEREDLRTHMEPCLRQESLQAALAAYGENPMEASISMLDDLLQLYPQMHFYGASGRLPGQVWRLELDSPLPSAASVREPSYERIPLYEGASTQAGCSVELLKDAMPEFISADDRVYPGLMLMDALRTYPANMPYVDQNGIWWRNTRYGLGAQCPDMDEFYQLRPIKPILRMLTQINEYGGREGIMKICGLRLEGFNDELNLDPLKLITIYRLKNNQRHVLRLMPGSANLEYSPMRAPYVVSCHDSEYLLVHNSRRHISDMENIIVPLHEYRRRSAYDSYVRWARGDVTQEWIHRTWVYNLDEALQSCVEALNEPNALRRDCTLLEHLMRLTEDSGFSQSIAGVDPQTFTVGQVRLLQLSREMIAGLCSAHGGEAAMQRLYSVAKSILRSRAKKEEIVDVLEQANNSIPALRKRESMGRFILNKSLPKQDHQQDDNKP